MFNYSLPSYKKLLSKYPDSNWYIAQSTKRLIDLIFTSTANRHRDYYVAAMMKIPTKKKKYIHQNMAQASIRVIRS